MRRILTLTIAWLGAFSLFAQKDITLEDIWQNGTFTPNGVPGLQMLNDGRTYTRQSRDAIEAYNLSNGEKNALLFSASAWVENSTDWKGQFSAYSFSADERKILLACDPESIYRYSSQADYWVFDRDAQTLARLSPDRKQRYPTFSPDGSKVAWVADNNLYFKDLNSGQIAQVTRDGRPNAIINGASDWVYEEEFEITRAFAWSPDGAYIAWLRFDESMVPAYRIDLDNNKPYPDSLVYKYPRVGQPNAVLSAYVYRLRDGQIQYVQTGAASDDYLPRIGWTPDGRVWLIRMNRRQNELRLLLADPQTGTCATALFEKNERYIELHDPVFLPNAEGFIWQSEKSGFRHLYHYDLNGRQRRALTKGAWEVTDFYGYDPRRRTLYFQAAGKSPLRREVYSVSLRGGKPRKVVADPGVNAARFSPDFSVFVHSYSTINTPPSYALRTREGKKIRDLETNGALAAKQLEYGVAPVDFFQIPASFAPQKGAWPKDGLHAWMLKPRGAAFQGKRLPLLMFVYGGPGSQQAIDSWRGANYWWFQMLAQQGYAIACVDNRGTGGRGEAFKKDTYLRLGELETADQIAAARYLSAYPFIDPQRIGIFGWSYGGFMSSLCILKGADVFKAAIAVAPVTHWKWYDSIYTERYMRTEEENPEGYADNAPVNHADKLRGAYLLAHGIADDNVHFQHAAELSARLIAANKSFDSMFYPGQNHGISGRGMRLHLYGLMTDFLKKNL